MTATPTSPSAPAALVPRRGAAWVVRRALFGIVLLMAFVAGGALLLNASIEPDPADGQPAAAEE